MGVSQELHGVDGRQRQMWIGDRRMCACACYHDELYDCVRVYVLYDELYDCVRVHVSMMNCTTVCVCMFYMMNCTTVCVCMLSWWTVRLCACVCFHDEMYDCVRVYVLYDELYNCLRVQVIMLHCKTELVCMSSWLTVLLFVYIHLPPPNNNTTYIHIRH